MLFTLLIIFTVYQFCLKNQFRFYKPILMNCYKSYYSIKCYFSLNFFLYFVFKFSVKFNVVIYLQDIGLERAYATTFYLSTDNATWHVKEGIFYTLKPMVKSKSKTRRKVPFVLHPVLLFILFLFYVATFQLNNFQYLLN